MQYALHYFFKIYITKRCRHLVYQILPEDPRSGSGSFPILTDPCSASWISADRTHIRSFDALLATDGNSVLVLIVALNNSRKKNSTKPENSR